LDFSFDRVQSGIVRHSNTGENSISSVEVTIGRE